LVLLLSQTYHPGFGGHEPAEDDNALPRAVQLFSIRSLYDMHGKVWECGVGVVWGLVCGWFSSRGVLPKEI